MSYSVGRRDDLDPARLWLWCRLAATAPIQPLAWEPPYAVGVALKKDQKTKKKKKKKKGKNRSLGIGVCICWGGGRGCVTLMDSNQMCPEQEKCQRRCSENSPEVITKVKVNRSKYFCWSYMHVPRGFYTACRMVWFYWHLPGKSEHRNLDPRTEGISLTSSRLCMWWAITLEASLRASLWISDLEKSAKKTHRT